MTEALSIAPSEGGQTLLELLQACCVLVPKHGDELKKRLKGQSMTVLRVKALTTTLRDLLENLERGGGGGLGSGNRGGHHLVLPTVSEDRRRVSLLGSMEEATGGTSTIIEPVAAYTSISAAGIELSRKTLSGSYNSDSHSLMLSRQQDVAGALGDPPAAAAAAAAAAGTIRLVSEGMAGPEAAGGAAQSYESNNNLPTSNPQHQHQQQVPINNRRTSSGNQQPFPPTGTSSSAPTTSPTLHHNPPSPMCSVLSSSDLLHNILGYLVVNSKADHARHQLNKFSLVCRRFRQLAAWDKYWKPVATGLLPVLGAHDGPLQLQQGKGGGRGGGHATPMVEANYRSYLLKYGRCLLDRRAWMGEALEEGYILGFEVWDAADGLRMLSASGPIRVQIDQAGGFTSLRIGGADRREVRGPAFSASSRDPEQRKFTSMEDYFSRGHSPEFPSALSVRVTVTDERTGRMALLWSTRKDSAYLTEAPLAYWEPFLLENSISVFLDHWAPLMSRAYDGESMTVTIGFHVCPEPEQEEVPEQDRLYRLAGGDLERYEDHQSYISITFMTLNTNGIHQFFRALLKDD